MDRETMRERLKNARKDGRKNHFPLSDNMVFEVEYQSKNRGSGEWICKIYKNPSETGKSHLEQDQHLKNLPPKNDISNVIELYNRKLDELQKQG
jgi:hypothetical protein